jgi:hypothetical protein
MIASNVVAPISGSLRAQVQKLQADALGKQESENLDPDIIKGLLDILDEAEIVLAALSIEEEKAQTDPDLSDAGRIKAMTKAVRVAHAKLRVIEKKATERREAYESESAVIHAAPKPASDSMAGALREMEIRNKLRGAPLHEQMQAYLTASQRGWRDTLRALKDAEMFEDSLLTAFIQRVDRERFDTKEPKQASRLRALKYCAEVLQALALGIDFRMSAYGEVPSFPTPPIGKTDLGFSNGQEPPKKSAYADAPPEQIPAFQ